MQQHVSIHKGCGCFRAQPAAGPIPDEVTPLFLLNGYPICESKLGDKYILSGHSRHQPVYIISFVHHQPPSC